MAFGSLGSIWAEMGLDIRKLDTGLAQAHVKLATADKTISSWGSKLTVQSTKLITVGGLMAGAIAGVGIASTKMAADFEKSMRNVNSISKMTETQLSKISDEVLEMSTRMPQSAKVLADGLYDIASSGFAGAEAMKVLEASSNAASAGLTTTAISAKGITAVLNAYGFEASEAARVSDTMFRTVDKGVITFEELSGQVGEVLSTAHLASISFEEMSGAIGYMTIKGINAAEATTSLNRLILDIIQPSEELAVLLHNAGYESGEMALKQLGLVGTLELVQKATGGNVTQLNNMFKEIRSLRGVSALLGSGMNELTDYMIDFKDTTGATNIALAEQSKSLDFQMQILKNNISAVAIAVGSELIPSITKYTTKLSNYISKNKEAIADNIMLAGKISGVTAAVLILLAVYGKLYALWKTHPIAAIIAAYALLNTVISAGASKIEEIDSKWSELGGTLVRTILPINAATDGLKKSISVWQAYRDGIISWDEAAKASNIFTRGEMLKTIEERRAKEEELTNGIYDSLEAFKSAQIYIKNYSDELPNATNEMAGLIQQLQNGELSAEAFAIGIEELRKATNNGRKDIEESSTSYSQYADIQEIARIKVEAHSKAQQEAEGIIDDTTGSIDNQAKSVDELRQEFNDLISEIFGITNAENNLQEAEWALEDAQKAVTEATKEHGEGSREVEQAVNDLDDAYQENLIALQNAYSQEGLTIERQKELKEEYRKLLEQIEETSELSQEEFVEMWQKFGLTGQEIIDMAQEMGQELDDATKERLVEIDADTSGVDAGVKHANEELAKVKDKKVFIDIITRTSAAGKLYSEGGIVKAMAVGGIIGNDGAYQRPMIAAGGLNIPQTGREVPITAHEYEVVANTSQQKNVADWFWKFINNPPDIKGSNVPIEIRIPVELDGRIIGEKVAKFIYDGTQTKSRLGA